MSELNVYHHELRPDEYDEFYLKYEADKVIAELKDKLSLKTEFAIQCQMEAHTLQRKLRQQKYRRCLDKAALCERMRIDAADYRIPREKWEFYDKWHNRWLELAEKFKPNKEQ